jgi:hypothetical protein
MWRQTNNPRLKLVKDMSKATVTICPIMQDLGIGGKFISMGKDRLASLSLDPRTACCKKGSLHRRQNARRLSTSCLLEGVLVAVAHVDKRAYLGSEASVIMLLLDAEPARMCTIGGGLHQDARPNGSCTPHAHLSACYDKRCCPKGTHAARRHVGASRLRQAWARGHQVVVE